MKVTDNAVLIGFEPREGEPARPARTRTNRVWGSCGVSYYFGVVSYRIRILLYREVSCVYPEGYTYLECILVYLKCILNALLISKRIHVQNHRGGFPVAFHGPPPDGAGKTRLWEIRAHSLF